MYVQAGLVVACVAAVVASFALLCLACTRISKKREKSGKKKIGKESKKKKDVDDKKASGPSSTTPSSPKPALPPRKPLNTFFKTGFFNSRFYGQYIWIGYFIFFFQDLDFLRRPGPALITTGAISTQTLCCMTQSLTGPLSGLNPRV